MSKLIRVQVISEELDRVTEDYEQARNDFEKARIKFDIARERFVRTRELASRIMARTEWYGWQGEHPEVRYSTGQIGNAVIDVLNNHAWERAMKCAKEKKERNSYFPYLHVDKIVETLELGGFEFRTTTPRREINATLINLGGVTKHEKLDFYATTEADNIWHQAKEIYKEQ